MRLYPWIIFMTQKGTHRMRPSRYAGKYTPNVLLPVLRLQCFTAGPWISFTAEVEDWRAFLHQNLINSEFVSPGSSSTMLEANNTTNSPRKPFRVAIDGPAGAGKSTLADALARALSFEHINTGIIYRALTLVFIRSKNGTCTTEEIVQGLERNDPEMIEIIDSFCLVVDSGSVYHNRENITEELRTSAVDSLVGAVAKNPSVRKRVAKIQKQLIAKSAKSGVVIEGRDIGTVVVPDAELKIFLYADPRVRALRRAHDFQTDRVEEIEKEIRLRDMMDKTRHISPLFPAKDALLIDNSSLTVEETTEKIRVIVAERQESFQAAQRK